MLSKVEAVLFLLIKSWHQGLFHLFSNDDARTFEVIDESFGSGFSLLGFLCLEHQHVWLFLEEKLD